MRIGTAGIDAAMTDRAPGHDAELGLWRCAERRSQPRDASGRFSRVEYTAHRLKVLAVARQMRADMGLPPSPFLLPFGVEE